MADPAAIWVELDELVPWSQNPRRNDEAVAEVAESIKRFGFAAPIIAREADRMVIAGHTRLKAAKSLGLDRVPVRFLDIDPADARLLALADNKLNERAEWDDEALRQILGELEAEGALLDGLGWDSSEIDALLADDLSGDTEGDDDAPPLEEGEPDSVPGQVYELGPHRLVCGDSTDPATWTGVAGAEAVITSPPYGVGIDYGEHKDTLDNLRTLLDASAPLWLSLVAPGGFAVVNFGDLVSGASAAGSDTPCEYPMALEYWPRFRAAGWVLWSRRAWCKPNPRCAAPWTASSNRAAADWENVWTWKAPGAPSISRQAGSNLGWIDTTKLHGVDVGKDTHGAGMPVGAAAHLITTHTSLGGLVLEPFCGTGTTIIAAAKTGRRCVGVEVSPHYCDLIRRRWTRWAKENGQDPGPGALDG